MLNRHLIFYGCKQKNKEFSQKELEEMFDSSNRYHYKSINDLPILNSSNSGLDFDYDSKYPLYDTCIKYMPKKTIYLKESCSKTFSSDSSYYFESIRIANFKYPNLMIIQGLKPLVYKKRGQIISIDINRYRANQFNI
jgi:hypothetical protein